MRSLFRKYGWPLFLLVFIGILTLGSTARAAGLPYSWGVNNRGQLGNNTVTDSMDPVAVRSTGALAGKNVIALAVGSNHSLALSSEGQAFSWGYNSAGQLGNGSTTNSRVPVTVVMNGALAGKTVTAISAGRSYSLALTADGHIYSWGNNENGQLGDGTYDDSSAPVAVDSSGALAGKTITAIAAGDEHCLALASDGTLYAWGYGWDGQLGNGVSEIISNVPVAVDMNGVLAGKTVSAIAAGGGQSLVLTTEGRVYAWGYNPSGELGNGLDGGYSTVPVAADMTGALAGKTVVAIAAGSFHCLALASDGGLYSWGANGRGQLGNGLVDNSNVPLAVDMSGALNGKSVIAIAAGLGHCLVLTADRQMYHWGFYGGDVPKSSVIFSSPLPQALEMDGALQGKTVSAIASGSAGEHGLAIASGTVVNQTPVLGNLLDITVAQEHPQIFQGFSVSDSDTPHTQLTFTGTSTDQLLVPDSNISVSGFGGFRTLWVTPVAGRSGATHITLTVSDGNSSSSRTFLLTVNPPDNPAPTISYIADQTVLRDQPTAALPFVIGDSETPADQLTVSGSSLNQDLVPNSNIVFAGEGANRTVTITPAAGQTGQALVSIAVNDGYNSGYAYFYLRVLAPNEAPTISGIENQTVPTDQPTGALAFAIADSVTPAEQLVVTGTSSDQTLVPDANIVFAGEGAERTVTVTPAAGLSGEAIISIAVSDGELSASATFVLVVGTPNEAPTISDIQDQNVLRGDPVAALAFSIADSGTPADQLTVTSSSNNQDLVPDGNIVFAGTGADRTVTVTPAAGQSGAAIITITVSDGALSASDEFAFNVSVPNEAPSISDIADQTVIEYSSTSALPFTIDDSGTPADQLTVTGTSDNQDLVPDGNIVIAFAGSGADRSVTVTPLGGQTGQATITITVSDGELETRDTFLLTVITEPSVTPPAEGQVYSWGWNYFGQLGNGTNNNSNVPVAVTKSGALAGKTVTAISSNFYDSFALTNDGKVYSWGNNENGQLGNGTKEASNLPVAVNMDGALAGKAVTAIANGYGHALALTADGKLYAWGTNANGELGTGTSESSDYPVAVDMSGALAGKTVTQIAVGSSYSLALTSDGRVYGWGFGYFGSLGNGTQDSSYVPVEIDTSGVLDGKTVTAIAAGSNHGLALTSEGQVFSWGDGYAGQLGDGTTATSYVPVAVDTSGVLAGKTIIKIAAGDNHNLALSSEGKVYSWGANLEGSLGNGTAEASTVPVAVDTNAALAGKTVTSIAAGSSFSLALTAGGHLYSWGYGGQGSLGTHAAQSTNIPLEIDTSGVLAGKAIGAISAGTYHTLVMATGDLGVNEAPTISDIENQTITKNNATSVSAFTVADSGTPANLLTVTGTSSNQTLVPNGNIVFTGDGADRTIAITPVAGRAGVATITVTVSDGSLSASDTFLLTVTLPADQIPPTVTVKSPLNGAFIK